MRRGFRCKWLAALALSLGVLLLALGCETAVHGEPPPPELHYVERVLGADRQQPGVALPLLVALHGLGDTPQSFLELFDGFDQPLWVVAPRAPDPWHDGSSWYPIDDPKRRASVIRARAAQVAELIKRLSRKRPTRGRALVTGFSQGGVLSFALAAYHPELLQAALPIAGMFDASLGAPVPASRPLPVIAFHGRADPRIAYSEAESAVERLKQAGRAAVLKGYEGVGHHISLAMREDYVAALREQLAQIGK